MCACNFVLKCVLCVVVWACLCGSINVCAYGTDECNSANMRSRSSPILTTNTITNAIAMAKAPDPTIAITKTNAVPMRMTMTVATTVTTTVTILAQGPGARLCVV